MPRIVYTDRTGRKESVFIGQMKPEITIGRQTDCDIRTGEPSVSRYHCTIRQTPRGFELTDQGSSYGTFVNGGQVVQHLLRPGDEIRCGQFVLWFEEGDEGTETLEAPPSTSGRQRLPPDGRIAGSLSFAGMNGFEEKVQVDPNNPRIRIGRTDDCDIQTNDGSVSRLHGEVVYQNSYFEYRDLGSANGSYVNDQRITHFRLKSGDHLRCGRFEIRFEEIPWTPPEDDRNELRGMAVTTAADAIARPQGSSSSMTPLRPAPDRGEVEQLKRELERAKRKTDRLEKENQDLEERVEELKRRATDAEDIDNELNRNQVVIDSLRDRNDRLKAESEEAREELERFRREAREARSRVEELEYEVGVSERRRSEAMERVEKLEGQLSNVSDQSFDSKRAIEDADRARHLAEFKLKRAEEDIERLEAMLERRGGDDGANERIVALKAEIEAK